MDKSSWYIGHVKLTFYENEKIIAEFLGDRCIGVYLRFPYGFELAINNGHDRWNLN